MTELLVPKLTIDKKETLINTTSEILPIKELYDDFKESEEYYEAKKEIKDDYPDLQITLRDLAIYSWWYSNHYRDYCLEHGIQYKEMSEEKVEIPEKPKAETLGISVMSPEEWEEYEKKLPLIKGATELKRLTDEDIEKERLERLNDIPESDC